jgi:hypothetical protein
VEENNPNLRELMGYTSRAFIQFKHVSYYMQGKPSQQEGLPMDFNVPFASNLDGGSFLCNDQFLSNTSIHNGDISSYKVNIMNELIGVY